jgi:hypothetical protein
VQTASGVQNIGSIDTSPNNTTQTGNRHDTNTQPSNRTQTNTTTQETANKGTFLQINRDNTTENKTCHKEHIPQEWYDKTPATCKKQHTLPSGGIYTKFYKHAKTQQELLTHAPDTSIKNQLPTRPQQINHPTMSERKPTPYVPRTLVVRKNTPKPVATIISKPAATTPTPAPVSVSKKTNVQTAPTSIQYLRTRPHIPALSGQIRSITPIHNTQRTHTIVQAPTTIGRVPTSQAVTDNHKDTPKATVESPGPQADLILSDEDDDYMSQYITDPGSYVSKQIKYWKQ